jgi:hypothetical protein
VTYAISTTRSWWISPTGLLLLAGLLSSVVAWLMIAAPIASFANAPRHAGHFALLYVHMLGGTVMIFFGAANLYIGASRRHFAYHKLIGRIYLCGGSLGAIAALFVTLSPAHKSDPAVILSNVTVSLVMLAVAWLGSAGMAYRAARNRRYDSHRQWIIRSYVLAWSFVFCRIASRVSDLDEMGGGEAFIWLSWVAPFIACEFALQWSAGAGAPSKVKDQA